MGTPNSTSPSPACTLHFQTAEKKIGKEKKPSALAGKKEKKAEGGWRDHDTCAATDNTPLLKSCCCSAFCGSNNFHPNKLSRRSKSSYAACLYLVSFRLLLYPLQIGKGNCSFCACLFPFYNSHMRVDIPWDFTHSTHLSHLPHAHTALMCPVLTLNFSC